jgi:zinc transporter ZupT
MAGRASRSRLSSRLLQNIRLFPVQSWIGGFVALGASIAWITFARGFMQLFFAFIAGAATAIMTLMVLGRVRSPPGSR